MISMNICDALHSLDGGVLNDRIMFFFSFDFHVRVCVCARILFFLRPFQVAEMVYDTTAIITILLLCSE